MDIDGLEKLLTSNHEENLRQFDEIKSCINGKVNRLDKRIINAESEIRKHDRSIVKIKTIGTFLGAVWTGFILLFKA